MKPKRTTSRTRLEDMIQTLREQIVTGLLPEGSFLPSELELCELHGLSKNTVRKGLEVLVEEGFIEKIPRIGAQVLRKKQKSGATLRFGYYPSLVGEADILKLVNRFNDLHPDIQVQAIPALYPRHEDQLEQYLQDDVFDVLTVNLYNYEHMSAVHEKKGLLEPFEPLDEAYSFLNKPFTSGDKQYVLPFVFTPVMLCYNKQHFREAKVPEPHSGWTWEDLCQAGRQLAEGKDRLGFYFHLLSENRWPIFLLQNNVRFAKDDHGRYRLRTPEIMEALRACKAVVDDQFPSSLSQSDQEAMSLFLNQKTSIVMATYSFLNALKDADFEYDIAPLPHLGEARTLLVIIGLAINRRSSQKQAAKLFVDFLMSEESQMFIRKMTLSLPSVKSAAEWTGDEVVKRPHRFHMYREVVHTFRLYSDLQLPSRDLTRLGMELRYYWAGLESLESVLQRLEETW